MANNKKKKDSTPKKGKPRKSSGKATNKAPRKDKGSKRGASRYNSIQKLLSAYCKDNGKHLDGKFNYYASLINNGTEGTPLEQVRDNFDVLYTTYVEQGKESGKRVPKIYPNEFPFYEFADKLISDPVFDGIVIGVKFDDGRESFSFKGDSVAMLDYYRIYMHKYLRTYHSTSPPAFFSIVGSDDDSVDYEVITDKKKPGEGDKNGEEKKPMPSESKGASQTDVDIARAKADEERAKTLMKALELFEKGLLSAEQLDTILNKLAKGGNV